MNNDDIKATPEYKAARYRVFYGDFHLIIGLLIGGFGVLLAKEPSWWAILIWAAGGSLLMWVTRHWYTLREMDRDSHDEK